MKNLIGIIDAINEELNKYLFKELNEEEETTFDKFLNAREFIQDIVKDNIEIKTYIKKRYKSKDKAFEDKCFLKRYANIETELVTHERDIFDVFYTLELLEECEEITQDDIKDYMFSYIY